MKKLYILFSLIFLGLQSFAQDLQLTLGESNATADYIPLEILGQHNDKYFMLSWVFGLSISTTLSNYPNSIKDMKVVVLDAKTMKREKLLAFPEFKGEGIERTGKTAVEGIILYGDTLNVFTSTWDKDAKDYTLHIWQLNAYTLESYAPKAKLITRIEDNGKVDFQRATVEELKFTNQIALVYFNYRKKTKETTIYVHAFDRQMNEKRKESIVIPNSKYGTGIRDIDVDKNGNIYFINAVSDVQFPDWDDTRWIRISRLPASNKEVTSVDIELKNGDPINGALIVSPTGELYVAGHYSKMIDPKDSGKELFAGSYIVQIDPANGQIMKTEELELTANQKKSLYARSLNPNGGTRIVLREMNAMTIAETDVDELGNITVVGYARYIVNSSTGRSSVLNFYSNSLLVTNFKKDATVAWQTMIPRVAFISQISAGVYPFIVRNNGNTHIIFSDDNDNIEPLSVLASGKKPSSKSTKDFKPKDYPPTDSDAATELSTWNIKGTAIRHTVIDSNGMWKVSWLNPNLANVESKIPIIDGAINKNLKNGEYLTSCFTKYSVFGIQKSAMLRIKF